MWEPPNVYALPTQEEVKTTKMILSELEIRKEAALGILQEAQAVVTRIEEEISRRTEWIAPIRRPTLDIMSLVLIEASRLDWRAPLIFEQVCKSWRRYAQITSRAWSHLPISSRSAPILVTKILDRGRLCPLHVHIAEEASYSSVERLIKHADRIYSLESHVEWPKVMEWRMPNLKWLRLLGAVEGNNIITLLSPTRVPTLEHLDISPFQCPESLKSDIKQHFAFLRHLVINDADDFGWVTIVEACADRLRILEVSLFEKAREMQSRYIYFPLLQYLEIEVHTMTNGNEKVWPFKALTPLLQSYSEFRSYGPNNSHVLHGNTTEVLHLHTNAIPDFDLYPKLRCLHISSPIYSLAELYAKLVVPRFRKQCPKFKELVLHNSEGEFPNVADVSELLRLSGVQFAIKKGRRCRFETPVSF